jgi:hypothetical protein
VKPVRILAIGVALLIAGQLLDVWWHATHPGFESAADQLRAHAVLWLGTLTVVWAATLALVRGVRNRGFVLVFIAAVSYGAVHVWHFFEHANGRDPDLPHLLLLVTNVTIFAGAGWVAVVARRRRAAA